MEKPQVHSGKSEANYRDFIFRISVSLPVAMYMMLYREKENLFDAFTDTNFWIGTLISYVVSLLILWMINRISKTLDKNYPWRKETLKRLLLQLWWGVCMMIIFTFTLVVAAFWLVMGVDITQTEYPSHDFPLVMLLIVLGNLYYLTYYLWATSAQNTQNLPFLNTKNTEDEKEIFMAIKPTGNAIIPQESIAIVFRQGKYILLRTFDRETHALDQSISSVFQHLNPDNFFKINPSCIINYTLCKSYKPGINRKLDVLLGSPMNTTKTVSRTLVNDFEKWMRR